MVNAAPSVDPANNDTMVGLMNECLKKFLQSVDGMLPAMVVAYDRATNRAQVQPLIQVIKTNGERVTRAQIASVPVFQIGAGGFVLNFPLKNGDIGWIKAADRDISLFLQADYSLAQPQTARLHNFADSVFFPNVLKGYTISGEDEENAVLQNLDGTVRIAIWPDKVKVTAPTVVIDSPETQMTGNLLVNGNISAGADGSGDVTINGNIQLNGNMVATGEVTAAGIPLTTHKHTGVQTGSDNTGNPIA